MNMRKILQQAQQMQEKMQRELGELVVSASVGGGMVNVEMNGHKQLLRVEIDPEAIDPDDREMLQDLVVAAVNEAARKVDEAMQERLGATAAGLPNLFG